jgi:outer membrane protein assembly factor BamB
VDLIVVLQQFFKAARAGKVYVGSSDGKAYCLNAGPYLADRLIWSYTTGAAIGSSPAVADGKVYIGSNDGRIYCFCDGSIVINDGDASTSSTSVTLTLTYADATSGVDMVRYTNNNEWGSEPWEPAATTKSWT